MTQKKYTYIIIAFCVTCSLMFLKKSHFLENISQSTPLRHLFEEKVKNYVCEEAGSRLTDKYTKGFDEKKLEVKPLTDSQQSIIDFARDTKYDNIKPYLKKIAIFIVILVLDIIFVIFWIVYCCCCCCSCCLFGKPDKPSKSCSNITFCISALCNLLVIIFSIIVLALINPYFERINGVGCSTFRFLDHVRYGLAPDYPNYQTEWIGINGLIDRLDYSNNKIEDDIIAQKNDLICDITDTGNCPDFTSNYKEECEETKKLIDSSFDIDFEEEIKELENANSSFNKRDNDIGNKIYDALHDSLNKVTKRTYNSIFSMTFIMGFFGLCFLILYKLCKYCIFKVLYVVVWNISMFFMLFAIIGAIIFGIAGYAATDGVAVANYILSSENIRSSDPLVFDNDSNDNVDDLIDVCINGDGHFFNILQNNSKIFDNIKTLEENNKKYQEIIPKLNDCPLKNNYITLQSVTNNALDISYNITNITCTFARNDKNIILNEFNSWGKRSIVLCAFSLLVAYLLGISILAGILFVHRYNEDFEEKSESNGKINESSSNIAEDNKNGAKNNYYNNSDVNINNNNNTGIEMANNMGMNNMNNNFNYGMNNMGNNGNNNGFY